MTSQKLSEGKHLSDFEGIGRRGNAVASENRMNLLDWNVVIEVMPKKDNKA